MPIGNNETTIWYLSEKGMNQAGAVVLVAEIYGDALVFFGKALSPYFFWVVVGVEVC